MDPPPPPSSPSSSTSFPILAISILGILGTAVLLLSYYIFVIKCRLNWRRPGLIRSLSTRPSRRWRLIEPPIIHSTTPTEFRGLEPSAIRAMPIIRFARRTTSTTSTSSSSPHECAVCLNEFHEEESLRLLPGCAHVFHIDCIDVWLQSNANCPLCRSDISTTMLLPFHPPHRQQQQHSESESLVIQVIDEATSSRSNPKPEGGKKLPQVTSKGDECIDVRGKDERFLVQPVRRSFSMDSCNDRQLYIAVQEILQQNREFLGGGGEEGGGRRVRRSFFSFGHGRSWRRGVLPVEI